MVRRGSCAVASIQGDVGPRWSALHLLAEDQDATIVVVHQVGLRKLANRRCARRVEGEEDLHNLRRVDHDEEVLRRSHRRLARGGRDGRHGQSSCRREERERTRRTT